MVKVVYIVRSAWRGGVENHLYVLIKEAIDRGYMVTLISLADSEISEKFTDLDIATVTLRDGVAMSLASFINIKYLYKKLKQLKPDIVHCHGTRPIFVGSVAAKLARVQKVILTVHNSYKLMSFSAGGKSRLSLKILSFLFHLIGFSLSNTIIFVSKNLRSEILETIAKFPWAGERITRKSLVVHNSVDNNLFVRQEEKEKFKNRLAVPENSFLIGSVGRLDYNKGIHLLLPAIKNLIEEGYDLRFIVVGGGGYQERLIELVNNLALQDKVIFTGYKEDLREYYYAMDALIISSYSEGLPLVLLEAMTCGIPVVATEVGAIPEVITHKESGIIVLPNSSEALKEGVKLLLDDNQLRKKMIKNALERIQDGFTKDFMIENTFRLYSR